MLLDGERAWIQRKPEYSFPRNVGRPETPEGIRDYLCDDANDGYGGIAEEEELVDSRNDD